MKKSKSILMLLTCGSMLFGGLGCLNLDRFLQYGVYYMGLEFISDNDSIFDLFESGNVPAA